MLSLNDDLGLKFEPQTLFKRIERNTEVKKKMTLIGYLVVKNLSGVEQKNNTTIEYIIYIIYTNILYSIFNN
jgi:hypothetical protein